MTTESCRSTHRPSGLDRATRCSDACRRRPFTVLAAVAVAVLVAVPSPGSPHAPDALVRAYRMNGVKISDKDFRKLEQGAVLSKKIDTDVDQETASLHTVRINVPPEFLWREYTNHEMYMETASALQFGIFELGPAAWYIGPLTLDDKDLGLLRKCEVGNCKLKLDGAWIRRFHGEIEWSSPAAGRDAGALFKWLLTDYADAYRLRGDSALTHYHDKKHVVAVAEQFEGILQQSRYLCGDLPELCDYMRAYPNAELDGLTDDVCWMKEDVGAPRQVTTLVHQMLYVPPGGSELVLASKQLYASHYFESALGLTRIIPAPGGEASYLIHVYRARIDALRGWGLFHGRIHSGIRNKIAERLAATKRRFEARWQTEAAESP